MQFMLFQDMLQRSFREPTFHRSFIDIDGNLVIATNSVKMRRHMIPIEQRYDNA